MNKLPSQVILNCRTFKNFGHKRQPIPTITTLWHGFLTFTFIGCGIEWKRIARFIFGGDEPEPSVPWAVKSEKMKFYNEKETPSA